MSVRIQLLGIAIMLFGIGLLIDIGGKASGEIWLVMFAGLVATIVGAFWPKIPKLD